ncbi:hypothetical protein ACH4VM_23325 [Streptomyces sp. NPDC020792]|uniref:phthiocerol/phthiodiolone dimycocerosyl transferase family protein n=1 Tax=Streptomyces sp. NPDC020792 TaxID=3365089 RepID=UPI0037945F18
MDGHQQLTCLIPFDLRPRLRPPLPADEFAFAAWTASATVTVGPETGLGTTAAEIGRRLQTALDAGHAELEYLATAYMLSRLASAPSPSPSATPPTTALRPRCRPA